MTTNSVWFVEDDVNDIFLIRRALHQAMLPIEAKFARSMEQLKAMFLVAEAQNIVPQALVTDLKLVGEDGFAIVEWIRRHPRWQALPIIVLTSSSLEADRERALGAGANHFLVKCSGRELGVLLADALQPFLSTSDLKRDGDASTRTNLSKNLRESLSSAETQL